MIIAVCKNALTDELKKLDDFAIIEAKRMTDLLGYNIMAILQVSDSEKELAISAYQRIRTRFGGSVLDGGVIVAK
jgi:hypothetical protein